MFHIAEFKSIINDRNEYMRPNKALCTFTIPPSLLAFDGTIDVARDMQFYCEAVNLPGYGVQTQRVNRWTYGPSEGRPYAPLYNPLTLSINLDGQGQLLKFFNSWMQLIMPHDWYNGSISQLSNYGYGRYDNGGALYGRQYELAYKSDYACDFIITVYNNQGDEMCVYFVKEAFPVLVNDIEMNHNDQQKIAKLQVTMDYLDWTEKTAMFVPPPFGGE